MWMTCGDEFESRTNNPLAIDALASFIHNGDEGSCWGTLSHDNQGHEGQLGGVPALNSQSVSYAVLQLTAGTPNPLHTHPRSSALMFLVEGSLQVGFVDSIYNLFTQTLQAGDIFVFLSALPVQWRCTETCCGHLHIWERECRQRVDPGDMFTTGGLTTTSWPSRLRPRWLRSKPSRQAFLPRHEEKTKDPIKTAEIILSVNITIKLAIISSS
ncbi:hypothetical protein CRG98_025950 [Punica granatum]|uniref:Germin-like protein n=1 Tax=Punica granatum TaxID=22663 RepID=A0A2I0JBT4_PUNGR|nr:hypothetical protein CRG98_025950 [Punica granatum]